MERPPSRIDLFKLLPKGAVGVEVGVWRGYLSYEILCQPNIGKLYMVDTWGPYLNEDQTANEREARLNVAGFGSRAEILKMPSLEAAAFGLEPLDFVYIDAAHDEDSVALDLRLWAACLKPDGVLMGHDYTKIPEAMDLGFGVVEAVNKFCEREMWTISHLTSEPWASFRLERCTWRGAEL